MDRRPKPRIRSLSHFKRLKRLFTRHTEPLRLPETAGRALYAVGDVHGRADLLVEIIDQLRRDAETATTIARPLLVFVGDYIDRGRNSREVIDLILAQMAEETFEVCALLGNHDQFMLTFLDDPSVGPTWVKVGGLATLRSYGVDPPRSDDEQSWSEVRDRLRQAMPEAHLTFLRDLQLCRIEGAYLFVHAGLRPGTPLAEQTEHDLLWIREPFLSASKPSGYVVVHGHTPAQAVEASALRIGIDTGAYATGVLSAIRLQGGTICTFTTYKRSGPPLAVGGA